MIRPEILAPAGDPEKLRFAVDYGADAVYLAGKAFGMRSASGNFSREELAQAVRWCHERGVRVYVTVNTLPRDPELAQLPEAVCLWRGTMGALAARCAQPSLTEAASRRMMEREENHPCKREVPQYDLQNLWLRRA